MTPVVPFIVFNKPFNVLCQFRDDTGRAVLADYIKTSAVYPAGRLDYNSEGLMILTDDGRLQARISQPQNKLPKCYWVQVEGLATGEQMAKLRAGVILKDGPARADRASLIEEPAGLWDREPPIRERKAIPTSWLDMQISEGRNRQARRMTAAVGLPALRLIRHRIGPWQLDELQPGEYAVTRNQKARERLDSFQDLPFA